MEDQINGYAKFQLENITHIYSPEFGLLSKVYTQSNQPIKKGEHIISLNSQGIEDSLLQNNNAIAILRHKIAVAKVNHKQLVLHPLPKEVVNAPLDIQYQQKKIELLNKRLKKYQASLKKGTYSKQAVDDLILKIAQAQMNLNKAKILSTYRNETALILEKSQENIDLLQTELTQLQFQNSILKKRIKSLNILSNVNGKIISLPHYFIGKPIKQGQLLATIGNPNKAELEIEVKEEEINKIKIGQKVRFESATFSINQSFNMYYTGSITKINAIPLESVDNKRKIYKVTANIDYNPKLPRLPVGSSGIASIVVGRRSLLLQLVGWE